MRPFIKHTAIFFLLISLVSALSLAGCTTKTKVEQAKHGPSSNLAPEIQFVRFKTTDGLTLRGRIFGSGRVGIILAHMYPADQKGWLEAAKVFSEQGYRVLTFDFRGYGLSDGTKDIPKIDLDLLAALELMQKTNKRVFLIGASMGGTAVLKVASQSRVAGVATISAPAEFMGLNAGDIKEIKGPKLFMAAAGDFEAPETARLFYSRAGEPKEIQILPGDKHGTNLVNNPDDKALNLLVDWLKRSN